MWMWLHLCVNDPASGGFTGKLSGLEVHAGGESLIRLECDDVDIFHHVQGRDEWLLIEGCDQRLSVAGYRRWVGNWCWDAARVTPEVAARVLTLLRGQHAHCDEALVELYDVWHNGRPITAGLLKELGRIEG